MADRCADPRNVRSLHGRRADFVEPARLASRRLSLSLQDFRNRLSEQTLRVLGVPLRTTQIELRVPEPHSPDVKIGRIFDRNWELVSFLIPMALFRGIVKRHFARRVADAVPTNLSRLAAQWEEIVTAALRVLENDAAARLDSFISTIATLVASAEDQAPRIRNDLALLEALSSRTLEPL